MISEKIIKDINKQELLLKKVLASNKPCVIYGASVYAYVLFQYLTKKGLKIEKFVVDGAFKTADKYMGVDVITTEEIIANLTNYNMFVGVANYPSVIEKFAQKGIKDLLVVDVPDFLNIPNSFMDYDFVKSHESLFDQAYDVFEDDLSRATYIAAINTKINNDLSYINSYVRLDHLYFSAKEFPISNNETLLDVGGYNGDSIRDFNKICGGKFNKIISLEPFPKMNKELNETIQKLGLADKCTTVLVGAWDEKSTLSFSNTDMEIDSKISSGGDQKIEVDKIDSILKKLGSPVTYIKMDINGAEYNALAGAEETIKKDKPQIAIKMHVKEDFYRLPILLKQIEPSMKVYLRQRNYMSMMLVVYGVFK